MIKKNRGKLLISSGIILLPIVFGILLWNYLPEQMAIHWGVDGEADGFGSRKFAIFVRPVIMLATHWFCVFFTARDPENKEQSSKVFNMVLWILPVTSLVVCGYVYVTALGNDFRSDIIVRVLLGVMFVILGNYMPKCKQNHTIGVKVTWTLRNKENWNKTHRFTGRLWVLGGVILLVSLFVPMEYFMYVLILMILLLAFAPMVYSYVYYRKQLKAGTVTKEETVMTPEEKKASKISLAVGIIVVSFAAVFLFTGKFQVQFDETAFTIKAVYWDDATVKYEDIDNIEYRNSHEPGVRTFGYGTPLLIMGECENDEFGDYITYEYTSCDACVVLTVNEKILVINGKNEDSTKEIYDELIKRMGK